jgi:Flp pilus assembly protein TadB
MKIAGIVLAAAGLAYAVKQIREKKKQRSGWHKVKVEEKEEKEEGIKRTGSRYGSNPVKY